MWSFGAGTSLVESKPEEFLAPLANIWLTHASLARVYYSGDARGSLVKTMGERELNIFKLKAFYGRPHCDRIKIEPPPPSAIFGSPVELIECFRCLAVRAAV